jgi:hypothetical protein
MNHAEQLADLIRPYLPAESVDVVVTWIRKYKIVLTITPGRKSVFGDYRWPQKTKGHRISVNGDLNAYAFLITFVHEMAHLTTWEKYRNTVASHGKEWKQEFRKLMEEFSGRRIFPAELTTAFKQHLVVPSYSHCEDPRLMRALRKYDRRKETLLEELPEGALFRFGDKLFHKGKRLRKRFMCRELNSNRNLVFQPVTPVTPVTGAVTT